MHPRRISILGVGLLGGSLGLAAKARISNCTVVGYAHREATLKAALGLGAIDEGYEDLGCAVRGADCVMLCTPVGLFRDLLSRVAPLLGDGTIVSDVGSTKRGIVAAAEELLPAGASFVGSHPMAGSEKRGVQFARANLYDGALCILTPTPRTAPAAVAAMEQFWGVMGMRTCRMSPQEHDRRLADVSHLPHAVAAALVSMQDPASIGLAGKGFSDMTRIAGGDGALWRDIFLDNRDNVRQSLTRLIDELNAFGALLEPGRSDDLRAWLDEAARRLGS
jgi:prephenate dehydrogenase